MEDETIQSIEPHLADRAIAVQTLAFSTDPVMRWLFPEAESYLRAFPAFARAFSGRAVDCGTAHAPEDFGGVAFWLPVGESSDSDGVVAVIEEEVRESIRDDLFSILEEMERFHPDEPHWYLTIIGVDPARQGCGLGGAILDHGLRLCDEEGLPAYLESSNPANISLYQRHGFEIVGEIRVGDAPVVTPMMRRL